MQPNPKQKSLKGFCPGMTHEQYHKINYFDDNVVSSSFLKMALDGPIRLKRYLHEGFTPKTRALEFGDLFHKYVLEPDVFKDEFHFIKHYSASTKLWKESYKAACERYPNKTIYSEKLLDQIKEVLTTFPDNALEAVRMGSKELSLFVEHEGVKWKVRYDSIDLDNGIFYDVKTVGQFNSFKSNVWKYGYDLQVWMYKKALEIYLGEDYMPVWVVVSSNHPYLVDWYQPSPERLMEGEARYYEAMEKLRLFEQSGHSTDLDVVPKFI